LFLVLVRHAWLLWRVILKRIHITIAFHIYERLIDYKRNAFLRGCNSRYHLSSDEAKIKKHLFTELFNESFFSLKVEITGAISREKRG